MIDLRLSSYNKNKYNTFYYTSGYKIGETYFTKRKNLLKEKINQIKKGIAEMIEIKKTNEIEKVIQNADNFKYIIEHKDNYYNFKNLKYKIVFVLEIKEKSASIKELIKNSNITFFSMYSINFGKVNENGTYDLTEYVKQLEKLKKKIISKYAIYFMAAEKCNWKMYA